MIAALTLLVGCGGTSAPVASSPVPVQRAPQALAEARRLAMEGQVDASVDAYQRAVDASPGDPALWIELGHVAHRAGRPEVARGSYATALQLDPEHVVALLAAGELARSEGRCDEALEPLARAAQVAPRSPTPWEHLAACHLEAERWDAAERAIDEAATRGSDQVGVLRGMLP